MPLPAGVDAVTLNAGANGLLAPDGTARAGTVTLTPSVDRVVSAEHGLIVLGPSNATLSASGTFTLGPVLATDAAGFEPTGWTYRVDENFTGQPPRSYSVLLPAASPTVALQSLVEVEASDGTVVLVPGGGTPSSTVVAETSYGQASDAGSATTYARGDHTHGTPALPPTGTTAGTYAAGNDSRLSDARTPTAHASSHGSGGSDPVTPAAIGADPSGTASAAVTAHAGASDPHADRAYANATFATQATVSTIDGFLNDCLTRVAAIEGGTAFLAGGHYTDDVEIIDGFLILRNSAGDVTTLKPEPWRFDVTDPAYGAVGNAKVIADGAITTGTAVLTSPSNGLAGATVGMYVSVKGAGPTGVTTHIAQIASVQNDGQVTLNTNAASSVSGAIVIFGTDDTAAIQAAVTAAETYLATHTYAQVYFPPRPYIVAGALNNTKSGNGQIVFGPFAMTGDQRTLHFAGGGIGAPVRSWLQTVPVTSGACLISFGVYASTSAQTTNINADGNPAVICGPNEGWGYGVSATFSNMMAAITNLSIITTHSSFGLTYGAANLWGCAKAHIDNLAYGTAGTVASPSTDYSSPGTFGTGLSVGLLLPAPGNNDHVVARNVSCNGGYTYAMFCTEHAVIDRYMALYCWAGLVAVGTYAGSVGSVHAMDILSASIEACTNELYILGAGSAGVGPTIYANISTESGTPNIAGSSATAMNSALGQVRLTGLFTESGVSVSNPTGIEIINGQVPRAIKRKTGAFTCTPIDRTLVCDTTSAGFTGTLPAADFNPVEYVFKNVGANNLTVGTTSSQLIYTTSGTGATTATVTTGQTLRVQALYNGSSWGWYAV